MPPDPACVWAFSYLRFSDPVQFAGDTLRRQRDSLESWLARNPHVKLDKSLKAWDGKATSGFSAEHRTNPKYVLAQFDLHVNKGRVPPGSYLVVENLDRLTREFWTESVPYVLALFKKGIRIVQLSPVEVVYDSEMDQGRLMLMLMELGRAHGESKLKSERVGAAWRAKKEAARSGVPHGHACPAWVELCDGAYRLRPEAAVLVRQIYQLSARGMGSLKIKQHLESTVAKPFAGPRWVRGYIAKILRDRSVLGEYQPKKWTGGKWVPEGDPVPNYYPAAVTEGEFYASQAAQRSRMGRTGRPARRGVPASPFVGLLRCANDGAKLYTQTHRSRRYLVSSAGVNGEDGSDCTSFSLDHFVDAVLSQLRELSAAALFDDPVADQVDELQGKLRQVKDRLAVAVTRFEADPASATWADRIDAYERERRQLEAGVREATQAAATPVSSTWGEAVELMRQNDPGRLHQCLLETISEVWVLIVPRSREEKLAAVEVRFIGGGTRGYLILSRNPRGWWARRKPAGWVAWSLAEKVPGGFDLGNRKQAAKLSRLLEKLDLDTF